MKKLIHKLRQKDERTKEDIAFWTSGIIVLIILILWVIF